MTRQLANTTEQTLWIRIGDTSFTIRLYEFRSVTYADVKDGTDYLICGVRVLPNKWILPGIVGTDAGNFRFESYSADRDEYPVHDGFNEKFVLSYYTADEIAEMEE